MLKMMEVIGISNEGYSEAVRQAVEEIVKSGKAVHFFEIVEQRGAVRGKGIEYQAKIKVAVE